ncbi:MAG: glycyl-radical enzyme activating protein [Bacteroidales bacterium]|nr:glycyl-radical enzyme activating protein [Bacteroidales bacterium]
MTKGIVFDIKRFAVHDGPGIRTTIFLKGCPLSCWWCHNPESRDEAPQHTVRHRSLNGTLFEQQEVTGYETNVEAMVSQAESDRIFYEESGGGVTLSGGEPLYQPEFCTELLHLLKEKGIHSALDTTGYAPEEVFQRVMPFTDLFLYDLKLMDDAEHQKFTGVSNRIILNNLKRLFRSGKKVIIRLPVIPGITDNPSNIQSIVEFLGSMQKFNSPFHPFTDSPQVVHLLPYHDIAKNKYRRFNLEDKMAETNLGQQQDLSTLKAIFEASGFLVQVGG